ncbi:MAG TPA: hypothetical protein VNJ08_05915 [Bacteriovoracaceae bacterium]|nr:hypothetical protein [Bacteriovoracaceae bacterium]
MKILAALTLALTLQAQAAEVKLATITTDTMAESTIFYVDTNTDGSAQGLRYVTTSDSSGQITEDVHNTIAEVLDDGSVLEEMEGRVIITLFLEEFNADTGGKIRLNHLVNGATGSRSNIYLKLVKKNGVFALADANGNVVNTLFVKGNWSRWLRRWIGVSTINATFNPANI